MIFSSELREDDREYSAAAERMEQLAAQVPGFLGFESVRQGTRGISVSYWESEDAIFAWRQHPEHLDVQARGKAHWYRSYTLRVARVTREVHFTSAR